jgi:hypothetical protein
VKKPKVNKRGFMWDVTFFGDKGFSKITFADWPRAIEAAVRGAGKEPLKAVGDEWFLLNAERALNKMIKDRVTR